MPSTTSPLSDQRGAEPHPERPRNVNNDVDYAPQPDKSQSISASRESIKKSIVNLYSGSASEQDMSVYAEQAVYDDPFSYCDTRYACKSRLYTNPLPFHPSSINCMSTISGTKLLASGTASRNYSSSQRTLAQKLYHLQTMSWCGSRGRNTHLLGCTLQRRSIAWSV